MHYTSFVDVLLLLVRQNHVLPAQRHNTGYADGQWNLPSGKLNEGEDLKTAVIRETREEIGLRLHRNTEPHKCARIGWFPLDQLPHNTVPYSRAGIELYRRGEPFGLQGWSHPAEAALAR
ncbi:MAG: NUDIX domain-containing protein [Pseudonocardiaceae bacterium]